MEAPDESPLPPSGKSGTLFALAVAFLLAGGLVAQAVEPIGGLLWTEIFVFLLPAVAATAGSNLAARPWLRLRAPSTRAAALGLLAGAAGWLLGTAIFGAVRALAPAALVERYDLSRLFDGPAAEQAAIVAAAVVVAPLCEEIAFRGYLLSAFGSRHRPAFAIGASALLFALLHLDPLRAPALLVLGALYAWLAWRSGSIWPAAIAHAANNGIAAALALAADDAGTPGEPPLRWALVGIAAGALMLALVVALHRGLLPPSPQPEGLPRADPGDPSVRFRPSLLPRPLVAALAAGAVSLGAILLAALRSRLALALLLALPALAAAEPLAVESRVGDAPWARRAAVEARAGEPVALRVAPVRGGAIRWYRIVPDLSAPYNNAVWPWDPGAYRWIGYARIRYERVELPAFRGRWEVALTPDRSAWGGDAAGPGGGLPAGLGSHWFQAEVELPGRLLRSPGLEATEPRGLSPEVLRVTFRDGDDLVGQLTGYFNVPGVFGSVPWQVRNYVGVDCADVLMAALHRARRQPIERDFNVAMLTRTFQTVAAVTLADGRLSRAVRWGTDVRRGDFVAVKYPTWSQFGHVGALLSDGNGDGLLDGDDLVIHAGPNPLAVSPLGGGAFDGELRILRPK